LCIFSTNTRTESFKHAAHTPYFTLQNAIYFIMLLFLLPALFSFYIQDVLKFKCQIPVPKCLTSWDVTVKGWVQSQASPCNFNSGKMAPRHSGVLWDFFGEVTPGSFSREGVYQVQLRTEGAENVYWGAVNP
jgi:hypothetical protein